MAEVSDMVRQYEDEIFHRTLLTQSDVVLLDRDLVNQPLEDLISKVSQLDCQSEVILIT